MLLVFFSAPLVMKKVNNEEKENRLIMCLQSKSMKWLRNHM